MSCPFPNLLRKATLGVVKPKLTIGFWNIPRWTTANPYFPAILVQPPRAFNPNEFITNKEGGSAQCPAIRTLSRHYFLVPCPIDIHLGIEKDDKGKWSIVNRRPSLDGMSAMLAEFCEPAYRPKDMRSERPIFQIPLGLCFASDVPDVWLRLLPPFLHYVDPAWPGTMFAGEVDIYRWACRGLSFGFEWWDTSKDLSIKFGQPWAYLEVIYDRSKWRGVELVECESTPDVEMWVNSIHGVTSWMKGSQQLFEIAELRRPKTLIKKL